VDENSHVCMGEASAWIAASSAKSLCPHYKQSKRCRAPLHPSLMVRCISPRYRGRNRRAADVMELHR